VEEMRNLITQWKWGTLEMKSLWKALLKAQEAVDGAESAKEVQERLPNWPWHHVEISELKETFKEDQCQPDVVDRDGGEEIDGLTSRQRRKGRQLQRAQRSEGRPAQIKKTGFNHESAETASHDCTTLSVGGPEELGRGKRRRRYRCTDCTTLAMLRRSILTTASQTSTCLSVNMFEPTTNGAIGPIREC
jgi:hypothetical protein